MQTLRQQLAQAKCSRLGITPPVRTFEDLPLRQRSFRAFLGGLHTIDKARAGEVRPWPSGATADGRSWDDYWADWEYALLHCQRLLIDKTRRTMASNVVCAWDLWLMAGGVSEEWDTLKLSTENRVVLVQARRLDGEIGAQEFIDRIGKLWRAAVQHGMRDHWPGFLELEVTTNTLRGSNGSLAQAVPQGANQIAGPGATHIHMEELGRWEQAEGSIGTAIPALSGVAHLTCVTTPNNVSFARKIRDDELPGNAPVISIPLKRLGLKTTRAGWHVLEIRGARDVPDWDAQSIGAGMDKMTFRSDILGDWTASTGKLVYPEFASTPEDEEGQWRICHVARNPLPFDPDRPLMVCWDQGGTSMGGTPAAVFSQLNARGQWLLYGSELPADDESIGIWEFARRVANRLTTEFAEPAGLPLKALKLVHVGDKAGSYRPVVTASANASAEVQSCWEIVRDGDKTPIGRNADGELIYHDRPGFGWEVEWGEVRLTDRVERVRMLLSGTIGGGLPMLVVDPGAKDILTTFEGGYHFKQRETGAYELDPAKNRWANLANAVEYGASRLDLAAPEKIRRPVYEENPHYGPGQRRAQAKGWG